MSLPPIDLSDYDAGEPLERARTLPRRWYVDPAFLEAEQTRLFPRSWQWVGRAADVEAPASFFTAELFGEPLLVVRDAAGTLRCLSNVCRHRAGRIADGAGQARSLSCRYHGWRYALDGRLEHAREMDEAAGFDPRSCSLPAFDVAEWGPCVFVRVDPGGPSLAEAFGEIEREVAAAGFAPSAMTHFARRDYDVACNWKVYVDNYLEGYHIPIAHPALFRAIDYAQYRVEPRGLHSKQHAPLRSWVAPREIAGRDRRFLRVAGEEQALYYWIFPNLMLNFYPDNLQLNVVVPLDHRRTRTVFEWYAAPDLGATGRRSVEAAIEFSDEVQREDILVCEDVQRGLASRHYERGRFAPRGEAGVYHFQQLVARHLRAVPPSSGSR
jgi:phenylpropionate dioxygenase-like ring-hydroxylating dioxygenase large terminal subunit